MFPHRIRPKPERTPRAPPLAGRLLLRALGYLWLFAIIMTSGAALGPGLPDRLNPLATLDPTARPSFLTGFKLDRALHSPESCLAVLEDIPDMSHIRLGDREISESCHIRGHVRLRGLSGASLAPVSTTCATALRLYMWERHDLQPAAAAILGARLNEIRHLSSFSCRPVRVMSGEGDRMSAHATASAIDVSGIVLTNGRHLDLESGWSGGSRRVQEFWRAVRNGACRWFPTVLSPDFNDLHADHFHLGEGSYGACR